MTPAPVIGCDLLLAYAFPPIGGGIARWMAEIARRYPPPGVLVSTGQHPDSQETDEELGVAVDRLPIPARRLGALQGLLLWSRRVSQLARSQQARFIWCGDITPAGYPAKWTHERVGTPFGLLLHGADLLVLPEAALGSRAAWRRCGAGGEQRLDSRPVSGRSARAGAGCDGPAREDRPARH